MRRTRLALVLALMSMPLVHAQSPASPPAAAPAVAPMPPDPWQWLEDVEGERSMDWVKAENAETRAVLEAEPGFARLRDELLAILDSDERIPFVVKRGDYLYNFWRDRENPAGLWRRTTLEEYRKPEPAWDVLLDLDALNRAENMNWVWRGANCLRPAYDRCLVSLSRGGADAIEIREWDKSDRAFVEGGFRLPEAKGGAGWRDADHLFVFTDFGPGSMTTSGYPRQAKLWRRGTPLAEAELVFEGRAEDMFIAAFRDHTPGFERDFVSRTIAFYNDELFLRGEDGTLTRIDAPNSANKMPFREWLILELREDYSAGGRTFPKGAVIATRIDAFLAGGRDFDVLFEPTPSTAFVSLAPTRNHLVLNVLEDVKNRLYVLTHRDGEWSREPLHGAPAFGTVSVSAVDPEENDDYFLTVTGFLTPTTLKLGRIGGTPEPLKQLPAFFNADGLAVSQHFATSRDGTRVPYFMIAREGIEKNGRNPTLLYGYGGFEISLTPAYSAGVGRAWLEAGGVYVVANIRGGGEYGPRWHQAGLKQNRPRVFEDFAAVAEDLIARGITTPRHLGIQGASNGGLLVGNMLVHYPQLFGAVVCQVPLLDMRRYHLLLAGASWMAEYGNPDDPAQWAFIEGFSPYHNVRADGRYPPVLFTTSTRDDRVHPAHARKMHALMESKGHASFYYENIEGGHGGAANNAQTAYMNALAFTFLKKKLFNTADAEAGPVPPVAAQRPHEVRAPHGAVRIDEFYWLRDDTRQNPEMLALLEAENAYADAMLAPLSGLKQTLFDEIVGRVQQDDSSVPFFEDGFWYYTRFETGKDYPIVARRKGTMEAPEEILLDQNAMAEGKDFFQVGNWEVSPDGRLLAWAEDLNGRRQFTIRVKEIATGEVLPDVITGAAANIVWGDDNRTIWYVENHPETLLTTHVRTRVLGTPASSDRTVYTETDTSFYLGIGRTRSEQYICIGVQSTVSSEQRCTPAANPGEFTVIAPRERDVEYSADHHGGRWVITTNWNAPNFRIMTVAEDALGSREAWQELVPHADDVFIEGVTLFDGFMAIGERSEGLRRIRILEDGGESTFVKSDEPAYTMALSVNPMPDTPWVRYTYTSLTTPVTTYEINVRTGERRMLKQDPVPGFDPTQYVTERLWVTARDGKTRIPVSLVYRKGFERNGEAAMLQMGYGAYGISMDPTFSRALPSLLDRGMVYAIAHIRGGQEMGRAWYDQGRLFNKKNTFTDFIDVTAALVEKGYVHPERVAAIGGSAGGLLMGAISNMAPEKYDVIVSLVPFVDVVTTMLDPSIPLTTNEYDEWGNPEQREFYEYMLAYSPYDNLSAQEYPAMFVGTGLWDSQVQYWEPAKYVQRLRARMTGGGPILFRVNMEAGHGGRSGRFQRFKEAAEQYAFLLDQLGVEKRAE